MKFELIPILDKMEELYSLPRTRERFEAYLHMLQGPQKEDMILPIASYNPMGKENVLERIRELKELDAEGIIGRELNKFNNEARLESDIAMKVVINLADDIGGAWSNFYTTDFSSKFEIQALIKRQFCTPIFWMSEAFTDELIAQRAREYVYRSLYWMKKGKPLTLEEQYEQEVYVQSKASKKNQPLDDGPFEDIEQYYTLNKGTEDYNLIFNFFYGDEASEPAVLFHLWDQKAPGARLHKIHVAKVLTLIF